MDYMNKCTKCGKEKEKIIIINTTPLTFDIYLGWYIDNRGLCIHCFVEEEQEMIKKFKDKKYKKPDWAIQQIMRDGMIEDICEHGVGHPNHEWYQEMLKIHGKEEGEGYGIHGCDGCCFGKKLK